MPGRESTHERGILERRGAEHHPLDARVEQCLGSGIVTHASPGLHGHVDRRRDRTDHRTVHRLTGARRVEVDDVDPRRAGCGEGTRLRDGIVAVHRLAVVVTLVEPHTAATEQVDGGIQVHLVRSAASGPAPGHAATERTKLSRICKPVAPDFSGWNCMATTWSRCTAATTLPP